MLNTVYQLKAARQFEVVFKNIELDDRHVLVRPTHLSICHADQRYYQGTRPEAVLRAKLPRGSEGRSTTRPAAFGSGMRWS